MTLEVDIRLTAKEFAFGQIFQTVPTLRVEFDRSVPMGHEDKYLPLIWIEATEAAPNPEGIEEAFAKSPNITEFELLATVDEKRLYRLHWQPSVASLLEGVRQTRGTLTEGYGEYGEWVLHLRFATQANLSEFNDYCQNNDINFTLDWMMDVNPPGQPQFNLTAEQLDALRIAYNHGYYEIPRGVNQEEISDRLGVSHQAASERLRRANKKVIEQTMGSLFDAKTTENE